MRPLLTISLAFLQFFFCDMSQAQQAKLDSLKKILPSLKDTARIECIIRIWAEFVGKDADQAINKEAFDSAVLYLNTVEQESRQINYIHGIASSYGMKAAIQNRYFRNFSEAVKCAREGLNWFDLTNNKQGIEILYYMLFVAFSKLDQYDDADSSLQKSYEWAKRNHKKEWMYNALVTMYEYYRELGDYDKAFEAFQKYEELTDSLTGKKDMSYENYVLGELQRRLGNYSIALNHYHQAIASLDLNHEGIWLRISYPELFALNGQFDSAQYYYNLIDSSKLDSHDLRYYLMSIGAFYLLRKKYNQALSPLLRGLQYRREANDIPYVKRCLIDVARVYAAQGKDSDAIAYAREGIDLSSRTHAKQYIRDGYQILYEIYRKRKEPDSAFKYYQKYVTQKEIVASDVVKGKFAAYNYQQQIALLDKEKIVQKQKLQKEETRRNILIGTFLIGLLFAVFLIRNIQLKRRKDKLQHLMTEANTQLENRRKEQQLAEIQQQKTELEMQALRAQMNPHFIFNSLSSINMFILENNKLQASEYLSKFSKLMRLILQNSQEAFIPLERELEALHLYLELESLRFDKKFEYNIVVDDEVDTTVLRVPPLIIQPYAENAIWHGLMHKKEKGHLEIELQQDEDALICKIRDDGVGRKEAEQLKGKSQDKHKSIGTKITESRIAMTQLNGSAKSVEIRDLVYADGSAAGTEVTLKIPVNMN